MRNNKRKRQKEDSKLYKYDESYNQAMEKSYESILFLGTSLFSNVEKFNNDFLSTYILVMKYFIEVKEFDKVESIVELLLLKDKTKRVTIDSRVIEEISVSLN